MEIRNIYRHLKTIGKHKWIVFKLCVRAGIPWRGIVHDLSKYSWTEFWEGVRYFQGDKSPITACKKEKGYSAAWLHHKGRNKHHAEYWYDSTAPDETPIIPYSYAIELICDNLSAGMVYQGKKWDKGWQLYYWTHAKKEMINEKTNQFITEVFRQVSVNGIKETIQKEKLKKWYHQFCETDVVEEKKVG